MDWLIDLEDKIELIEFDWWIDWLILINGLNLINWLIVWLIKWIDLVDWFERLMDWIWLNDWSLDNWCDW